MGTSTQTMGMHGRAVVSLGLLCILLTFSLSAATEVEADPKSCDDCELAASLKASKDEEKKAAEMEQYAKSAEAELEKESSRASEAQKRASDAATKTKMKLQKAAQRARRQQAKLNQDKTKIEGLK